MKRDLSVQKAVAPKKHIKYKVFLILCQFLNEILGLDVYGKFKLSKYTVSVSNQKEVLVLLLSLGKIDIRTSLILRLKVPGQPTVCGAIPISRD